MNAFEATNHYLSKASGIMKLGPHVEKLLLSLEAEHHVSVPIERDNGEVAVFSGYRFQHNSARGPTKEVCASIRRWTQTTCGRWQR